MKILLRNLEFFVLRIFGILLIPFMTESEVDEHGRSCTKVEKRLLNLINEIIELDKRKEWNREKINSGK